MSSTTNPTLDPYTAKAENENLTPQEKIDGLKKILNEVKHGMLTTISKDGRLHSRAMHPASCESLNFLFLGNNASFKFDEIEANNQVNIAFFDQSSTSWASISGTASISQDRDLIKKLWSPFVKGYFADLKDGVHKGDESDPRVSVIKVVPEEIRYWLSTSGVAGRTLEQVKSAVTGKATAPGELRTITKPEIQLLEGLNTR